MSTSPKPPSSATRYLNAKGYRQKRYSSRRQGDKGERPFTDAVVDIMLKNRL